MMYAKSILALVVIVASVAAAPAPLKLDKRIAQTISDSTTAWVQACNKAGGGQQCNTVSQNAFMTLLAAGGNCDQQNAADGMVNLAKQLNNDADMIRLAQIFVQQPRNAPDGLQVPYCQTAPNNTELSGFFHCQFAGSDFTKFSGDQTGNVPLGLSAVSPPGSCPAKTDGPVPDGEQLESLVTSPGTPGAASGAASESNAASSTSVATVSAASPTSKSSSGGGVVARNISSDSTSSFTLQNGLDAQKGNAAAASTTTGSPCTDGQTVCAGADVGQCVGGSIQTTACSGGTQCFILPLVNKAGTSAACTTEADASARIAATGATGGITGA